jgi:uncharacterized membrane protein YcaP (DUF421 family)
VFHLLNINWQSFLLGEEELRFLYEVALRTAIMFAVILVSLRVMGRRAIMQGLFEVALIIALGSAAGDAMFYSKVGLLPAVLVVIVIVVLYRTINYLMSKNTYFEKGIEGKTILLIKDGAIDAKVIHKSALTQHEIFSDLRIQNVSQLGQIEKAYLEPPGKISVFFYPDEQVRYGLPIFPERVDRKLSSISAETHLSCTYCGFTKLSETASDFTCDVCHHKDCVSASNARRVK